VLALLIALGPAVFAWGIVTIIDRFAPKAATFIHAALVATFTAIIAVQAMKHGFSWHLRLALPVAFAVAVLAVVVTLRHKIVRQWLRWLAIAPLFSTLMFLVSSPASSIAYGENHGGKPMKGTKPTRVVMIVFDEFPVSSLIDPASPGRIDAARFPNFAALAAGSTWYRNATTVAPFTDAAVPAILTGTYPKSENTPARVANHPNNLFTALGPEFKMHVHESVTDLCPLRLCTTAGAGGSSATSRVQKITQDTWTLWKQFTNPRFHWRACNRQRSAHYGPTIHSPNTTVTRTPPRFPSCLPSPPSMALSPFRPASARHRHSPWTCRKSLGR
jgi:hypothetical protein